MSKQVKDYSHLLNTRWQNKHDQVIRKIVKVEKDMLFIEKENCEFPSMAKTRATDFNKFGTEIQIKEEGAQVTERKEPVRRETMDEIFGELTLTEKTAPAPVTEAKKSPAKPMASQATLSL